MSLVAAIDCGTNSVRLLVARAGAPPPAWVERDAVVTRLGAGVDASGRLSDRAIERTVDAVAAYADRAVRAGADQIRIVATSAARDAANTEQLVAAVRARSGIALEILTGDAEAALAFAGAVAGVDPPRPALVVDVGGGSTEFVLGADAPTAFTSRQIGCVRLTEQSLPGDPPDAAGVARARTTIDRELDGVRADVDVAAARSLVGVAGTATTLAALHLGLPAYDAEAIHGTAMSAGDVAELVERLRRLPAQRIRQLGAVAPGREDVLLAGALLLERALSAFGFASMTVSECDLLDGACLALAARGPRSSG